MMRAAQVNSLHNPLQPRGLPGIASSVLGFGSLSAAIAGIVLSAGKGRGPYELCMFGFLLIILSFPVAILALLLGGVAQIRYFNLRPWAGRGLRLSLFGLLASVLGMLSFYRSYPPCGEKPATNAASTVGALRTINTACVTYASSYPTQGFPRSLRQLGPPANGEEVGPEHADLIDSVLASGRKSGYVFTYTPTLGAGKGVAVAYALSARPMEYGETAVHSFFTDQTGVIRWTALDRAATAQDPPLQ